MIASLLGATAVIAMLMPTQDEDGKFEKPPEKESSWAARGEMFERREVQSDGTVQSLVAEEGNAKPAHDSSQIRAEGQPNDIDGSQLFASLVTAQLTAYSPQAKSDSELGISL